MEYESLSKSDLKLCSLKTCKHPAAFEIYAGHNHFDTEKVVYTCAFDRVQVMDLLGQVYESVVWHDVD